MRSATRLQPGIRGAGCGWPAEAAFTEKLPFRRRAFAFHLWQTRAEDEWDHPHNENFPEHLPCRIHFITVAQNAKLVALDDINIADRLRTHNANNQSGRSRNHKVRRAPLTLISRRCVLGLQQTNQRNDETLERAGAMAKAVLHR